MKGLPANPPVQRTLLPALHTPVRKAAALKLQWLFFRALPGAFVPLVACIRQCRQSDDNDKQQPHNLTHVRHRWFPHLNSNTLTQFGHLYYQVTS